MGSVKRPQGGKRPGAGRKPSPDAKIRMSTCLARDVVAYLASRENKAVTIEDALRRTRDYREWSVALRSAK